MLSKDLHIEKVEVNCVATSDGYFNGKIIKDGSKFIFTGILKDGKFPLWCEPTKPYVSKFSKLAEKAAKDLADAEAKEAKRLSDEADAKAKKESDEAEAAKKIAAQKKADAVAKKKAADAKKTATKII